VKWSLAKVLESVHDDVENRLGIVRRTIGHPTAKGDASEKVWIDVLTQFLPTRYSVETAFIVDSEGSFSEQMDIVIYDRQYTPLIFEYEGQRIIPVESVYAVLEAKQELDAQYIDYAQGKALSVRQLKPTSLPIPHIDGVSQPKPPLNILAGIVGLDCSWRPPFGKSMRRALNARLGDARLDVGCVASHGRFAVDPVSGDYDLRPEARAATAFLFDLLARLQAMATVPMLDIRAYGEWLAD
jgi:uncharacterized protein DUF6602